MVNFDSFITTSFAWLCSTESLLREISMYVFYFWLCVLLKWPPVCLLCTSLAVLNLLVYTSSAPASGGRTSSGPCQPVCDGARETYWMYKMGTQLSESKGKVYFSIEEIRTIWQVRTDNLEGTQRRWYSQELGRTWARKASYSGLCKERTGEIIILLIQAIFLNACCVLVGIQCYFGWGREGGLLWDDIWATIWTFTRQSVWRIREEHSG